MVVELLVMIATLPHLGVVKAVVPLPLIARRIAVARVPIFVMVMVCIFFATSDDDEELLSCPPNTWKLKSI